MKILGEHYRSIWYDEQQAQLKIIDQTLLPFEFKIVTLPDVEAVCEAIITMQVRGAPLIGATAAYGLALALQNDSSHASQHAAIEQLLATRPTAVNLRWALEQVQSQLATADRNQCAAIALRAAADICDQDVATNANIGRHGLTLIEGIAAQKHSAKPVNILTHCNAGALATVDWGTALAPMYKAHDNGVNIHVWVDETRPRNQGASITAWELGHHGIPHTIISDNSGGHLMQHGEVDLCLVGSDRTTASGDVCNKIGTYLKALAAHDNKIPFYVCLPSSTIDWQMHDGLREIPIEQRDSRELTEITGIDNNGQIHNVRLTPEQSPAANHAFDVTPARLVTGLITEHGIYSANKKALSGLHRKLNS